MFYFWRPIHTLFFCIILLNICFVSCTSISKTQKEEILFEYLTIADTYASLGNYDKAIQYYEKSMNHPNYSRASKWGLVRMYALSNKWEDAQSILKPLYVENPENEFMASAYAFVLAKNGLVEDAVHLYEKIYFNNLDNPDYARNYVEILFVSGDYLQVIELCQELQEKFSNDSMVFTFHEIEQKALKEINTDKNVQVQ